MSLDYLRREGGTDIGHGVKIYAVDYFPEGADAGTDGEIDGIIEEHDSPSGRCGGYVKFRARGPNPDGTPSWVVEQEEPLTLSPSVLCRTCGNHGFIREGRWVPA